MAKRFPDFQVEEIQELKKIQKIKTRRKVRQPV